MQYLSVHKFGGTSVGDAAALLRTTQILKQAIDEGPCLVVVSACAGTTDQLIECLNLRKMGKNAACSLVLGKIQQRHEDLAQALLSGGHKSDFLTWLKLQFRLLERDLLQAARSDAPQDEAIVIGCGEWLSSHLIQKLLLQHGVPCDLFDAREFLRGTGSPLEMEPDEAWSRNQVQLHLKPALAQCRLVLTQGFICQDECGQSALLGRGGSDFSAGLFAAFLEASALVIWTDTPGVLSADPRKIDGAQPVPHLLYEEARVLAQLGAKVLHPRSVDPPFRLKIPVWVKSSFQPFLPGTLIHHQALQKARVKSITYKPEVVLVHTPHGSSPEKTPQLWQRRHECDAISITHEGWSAVLPEQKLALWRRVAADEVACLSLDQGWSLVSVVGRRLNEVHWLVAETVALLSQKRIKSKLVSVSPRGTSFSLLVRAADQDKALEVLHGHLFSKRQPLELLRACRQSALPNEQTNLVLAT